MIMIPAGRPAHADGATLRPGALSTINAYFRRSLVDGRRFLYDAALTSSRGDQSCASCHIFGDKDELAWDLGDPDGDVTATPTNIRHGAPLLGEHTREILEEFGYLDSEIDALVAAGDVIAASK